MGRGAGKDDLSGHGITGPRRGGGYHSSHGNPSGILQQEQGQSSTGPEDAGPPGFPSVQDLKELNRQIHDDAGTPERFQLDQPSPLESSLERARAAYVDTSEGVIQTAALLAHGIAQAQSFVDGNRRTAYFATLAFLEANGYGDLSPLEGDDHTLARYLNQVVEGQASDSPGPEKFARLFTRRLRKRRGSGKTEGSDGGKR
jgi:prophage maintenance system killer protein